MALKMKELPISERPYEKLEIYGVKKLSNAELLAIIIKTGTKEETAISLAQKILNLNQEKNIDNLRFLQNVSIEELCKIKGIGKIKAMQIIAAFEIAKRIKETSDVQKIQIKNSQNVADLLMNEMKYEKREVAKVILLNGRNIIQKIIDLSYGGTNFTMLEPKEVLYEAVKAGTSKIIVAHNHPSGDATPSAADVNITRRLVAAAEMIGLEVLDHVVIAENRVSKCDELFRGVIQSLFWIEKGDLEYGLVQFRFKRYRYRFGNCKYTCNIKRKRNNISRAFSCCDRQENGKYCCNRRRSKRNAW